jgi:hypothetical protein
MKIVVFGPERRTGALVGERIIDLNHGMAAYLRERGEAKPEEQAAIRLPSRLLSFIERAAAGVEDAQRVIGHFVKMATSDDRGPNRIVMI